MTEGGVLSMQRGNDSDLIRRVERVRTVVVSLVGWAAGVLVALLATATVLQYRPLSDGLPERFGGLTFLGVAMLAVVVAGLAIALPPRGMKTVLLRNAALALATGMLFFDALWLIACEYEGS